VSSGVENGRCGEVKGRLLIEGALQILSRDIDNGKFCRCSQWLLFTSERDTRPDAQRPAIGGDAQEEGPDQQENVDNSLDDRPAPNAASGRQYRRCCFAVEMHVAGWRQ
jgi:hypothetical protein